jgi:hypothetical protein
MHVIASTRDDDVPEGDEVLKRVSPVEVRTMANPNGRLVSTTS